MVLVVTMRAVQFPLNQTGLLAVGVVLVAHGCSLSARGQGLSLFQLSPISPPLENRQLRRQRVYHSCYRRLRSIQVVCLR